MQEFDYVIVGAGAAGCVLAHRLSEDPAITVALLEAGGTDKHPFVQMPKGLAKVMADPSRTWMYQADPEKQNAFSKEEFWARGRLMGGSSSINGMMYVRGQPADFDEIAAQSSDDWSWQKIGAAYKALESHELGADATRGDKGPLHLTLADRRNALTEAMIEAGVAMGLKRKVDVNAPDGDPCVGYSSRTIWHGRRQSASVAFIDPIRQRPNLTVITNALADKVNFDGRRARSVVVVNGDTRQRSEIAARREIILAAGAMASPGILQRSGIGDGELLQRLGIPVVQQSAQVGRRLLEHRGIMVQWKLRVPLSDNREFSGLRLFGNVLRYYLSRSGPMSSAAYEVGAWFKSKPDAPRPDVQFLVTPFTFDYENKRATLEKFPGMGIVGYPLRPTSPGEIHIKSRDPNELPALTPNYAATAEDRELMMATVRLAREYAAQEPLRKVIVAETFPGPQCTSEEDVLEAYAKYGSCGYHAIGSCRMGNDAESVVDPELRVRGVDGLRVCDTSIFPQMPSGNTNGPVMAVAWRAVDVIRRG
jgi:choline dehydrogenase-like flavoprotein